MGVPKFYLYQMPMTAGESFIRGFNDSSNQASNRKRISEQIEASKLGREAKKQEMFQSDQSFPLSQQHLQAQVDAINANTSLTPFRKQLLMAQAQRNSALAAHAGDLANGNPVGLEFAKIDAKNFANELDKSSVASSKADKVLAEINAFEHSYNSSPLWAKGAAYNPITAGIGKYVNGDVDVMSKAGANLTRYALQEDSGLSRITNYLAQLYQSGNLNASMGPAGVAKLAPQLRAVALQDKIKTSFLNELKNRGIFSSSQASQLWDEFTEKYPAIDENGVGQPQNALKWRQFLSEYGKEEEGDTSGGGTKEAGNNDPLGIR